MVECCVGLNAVREQLIDQSIVEIEAFRVRWTITIRKYARPRHREAIRLDAERLHQLHVGLVEVVMVVSNVAIRIIDDAARRVREGVPDRWSTSVFVDRTFDLIRSGCRAPDKSRRKCAQRIPLCNCSALWQSLRAKRGQLDGRRQRRRTRNLCERASGYFFAHLSSPPF